MTESPGQGTSKGLRHVEHAADAAVKAVEKGTARAEEVFGHGMDKVRQGASRAREGVHSAVEKAESLVEGSRSRAAGIGDKTVTDVVEDTRAFVRAHPGKSLVFAGLAGFVLGSLLGRRG